MRDRYVARRDALVKGLRNIQGVTVPNPGGAFYAVCELPIDNADAFCQWMLEHFDLDGDTVMMAPATGFLRHTWCRNPPSAHRVRLGLAADRARGGMPACGVGRLPRAPRGLNRREAALNSTSKTDSNDLHQPLSLAALACWFPPQPRPTLGTPPGSKRTPGKRRTILPRPTTVRDEGGLSFLLGTRRTARF